MAHKWYPLQFAPILKEKIWGGHMLKDMLQKTDMDASFGESWEIADLPDDQSIVVNGEYRGKTLGELTAAFAKALLGADVVDRFGTKFPLLIKFIDAADDLSVQLHPNDHIARAKHNSYGKTEMWYILHADEGAQLTIGFNREMSANDFDRSITEGTITECLQYINVKEGDAFFINAGLIHAIGKGVVLAEIQQTSDITYRVYDYNRPQADGTLRDLHIEDAKAAVEYKGGSEYTLSYDSQVKGSQVLKHSAYFKTDIVYLEENQHVISRQDSFTIIMVVSGTVSIESEGYTVTLKIGQTTLIPAACGRVIVEGRNAKFLEVYL